MEDVLARYTQPPDPARPLLCFDAGGKELQTERRAAQPLAPGHPARIDTEYGRAGMVSLFLVCAPHLGWRQIRIRPRRTRWDWAAVMREVLEVDFPQAEKVILVLDNLNTHRAASFYDAFPPAAAKRLLDRLELHFTPKHASWLNMAELELSVLARQCLDWRIPDQATLPAEVAAWVSARNAAAAPIRWRFAVAEARERLKHLYPVPQQDT